MLRSRESFESFYGRLSQEELIRKKKNLPVQYLVPVSIWLLSVLLFATTGMQTELLIAYAVSITGVFISLYLDYRKRKQMIVKILSGEE
jgi:hypothetical protein